MIEIIFIVIFALLIVGNIVQFGIIRGFLLSEKSTGKTEHLTGVEVEELRRKISLVGMQVVTSEDVLGLIKTIRDTHLGTYVDNDPYIPADPYEDIEQK